MKKTRGNRRHPVTGDAGSASAEVAMLVAGVAATVIVAATAFGQTIATAITDSCELFAQNVAESTELTPGECE